MEIKIRKIKRQSHYEKILDFIQVNEMTQTNDTSKITLLTFKGPIVCLRPGHIVSAYFTDIQLIMFHYIVLEN